MSKVTMRQALLITIKWKISSFKQPKNISKMASITLFKSDFLISMIWALLRSGLVYLWNNVGPHSQLYLVVSMFYI